MDTDKNVHVASERAKLEFLTVADVAAWLKLPKGTVTRLLHGGQLAGVYFGTRAGWRLRPEDVAAYVARNRQGEETQA